MRVYVCVCGYLYILFLKYYTLSSNKYHEVIEFAHFLEIIYWGTKTKLTHDPTICELNNKIHAQLEY